MPTDELVRLLCERLNLGPLPRPEAAVEETSTGGAGDTESNEYTENNEDTEDNKDNKDTEDTDDNKDNEAKNSTVDKKATATSESLSVHEEIARHIKFLNLTCEMLQLEAETAAVRHMNKPGDLEEVKKQIFTAIVHCQSLETRLWTLWRTGS